VQVKAVEPVVVDGQGVLQVPDSVVPPAWHKDGLSNSLHSVQKRLFDGFGGIAGKRRKDSINPLEAEMRRTWQRPR
jgi:hypothetical protein